MLKSGSNKFEIADLKIDPSTNSINKNGREKRVEPLTMQLLCYFADNQGKVLSREELHDACWSVAVVGDESITRAIFNLRQALGDDAKRPRFIETIPKKGYRFLPSVSIVQDADKPNAKWSWFRLIALLFVFLSTAIIILHLTNGKHDSGIWTVTSIQPVTNSVGNERHMKLNPATGELAYVYDFQGHSTLMIMKYGETTPVAVLEDKGIIAWPRWLNENELAYIQCHNNSCQLFAKNIGNEARLIYEENADISQINLRHKGKASKSVMLSSALGLIEVDLVSGARELLDPDFPRTAKALTLEENKNLYFILWREGEGDTLVQYSNGANQNLVNFPEIFDFELLSDNEVVISATNAQGTHGIWKVNLADKSQQTIKLGAIGERFINIELDTARQTLFLESSFASDNLVQHKFDQDDFDGLWRLNSTADEVNGVYGPKKEKIYFASNRDGDYELWAYKLDGIEINKLSDVRAHSMQRPLISNDGKLAVVAYQKAAKYFIDIIDLEKMQTRFSHTLASQKYPLFWPKNADYFYASEHIDELPSILKFKLPDLSSTIIVKDAGLLIHEDTENLGLRYIDYSRNALVEKLPDGTITELYTLENLFKTYPGQAALDGDTFMRFLPHETDTALLEVNLSTGLEKSIAMPRFTWITDIDIENRRAIIHRGNDQWGNIVQVKFNSSH